MPNPLVHLSDLAENAVSDIRLVAHVYGVVRRADIATWRAGRFGGPEDGFGDRTTQLAVANIVGIVEQYAESVLLDAGCKPGSITSWPNKIKAWSKSFSAAIEDDCPSFTPMWGFYDARNAIMHRRGELTHSQRKSDVYNRLTAAEVARVGYDIVVTEAMVGRCAEVCVKCIQELDGTLPSRLVTPPALVEAGPRPEQ